MDFRQYRGKNILAWLYYNPNYEDYYGGVNRVCYVCPRVLINGTDYDLVDPTDFPNCRIEVRIQGGDSAEDVYSRFGPLVNIRMNSNPSANLSSNNNKYTLKYNSQYRKDSSEIWIERFSDKGFYQIIDINNSIESLQKESFIPEPDRPIHTTLILLRYEGKLYGPFEYDTKEGKTILRGLKDYQYSVGEYKAVDYNDNLLVIADQDEEEALVLVPKTSIPSPEECENRYDWISEDILIDSFVDSLRIVNSYTRDQVRQLKEMVHQLVESGDDVQFTDDRIDKVKALLQNVNQKEQYVRDVVDYVLSDESMKTALTKEVVNNYFDQIQNKILEFSSVQERLNNLKTQEAALQKSVDALPKSTESEEVKKKIDELTKDLEKEKKKNKELSERANLHENIDKLNEEVNRLEIIRGVREGDYKKLDDSYKILKKQIDERLKSLSEEAEQTAKILDRKLLDKILRGIDDEPTSEDLTPFDGTLLHAEPMNCTDIIQRVTDFIINKAHRDVSKNDVANYLICITQGFITTFAGEPGTGKTSLCNILAKALGLLADVPQRRFVDISVERGWSSHKDYIGYYNPLSKRMERSNGEVFDAFERMDSEYGCDPSSIAPFIILLDEANLSPIEHYWAAFLRNCDFESVSNNSIPLGGTKSFRLPEHLRFLATVNFDHTTEELSPRFLDRSWIIMLEPTRIDDGIDEDIDNYEDMVSFSALKSAFCILEEDEIDETTQTKWNAIQKIFRDRSLQIMPRNLKMVKNYCAVACRCMDRDTPATKFAPLDYALSQKILPTINGNGENYRMLVEDLLKECTTQNMPITAKHLERMKRVAENNMGFYQFFSH